MCVDLLYKEHLYSLEKATKRKGVCVQARLSKRINELLVLAVLEKGPAHGYQVALSVEEDTGGAFTFQHGTLYPILHRMESEGRVRGEWDDGPEQGGRRRKTYLITEEGRAFLAEDASHLEREFKALFSLLHRASNAA